MTYMSKPYWQRDWSTFANFLQSQLQEGASQEDLALEFGGKEICWSGRIEKVDIDELAAVVDVFLDEQIISLKDGSETVVDGLSLSVAEGETKKWQKFNLGDSVTFTAVLGDTVSPFAPIEVKTLRSGKLIIMIRTSNALPV